MRLPRAMLAAATNGECPDIMETMEGFAPGQ